MAHRIDYTEEMVGNAHPTKADTLNRLVNLFTAAGDSLVGTAAATAAALAIGAANTKRFVNADGDGQDWAVGIKNGSISRDTATATGTQAITGVGFKPSAVIFIAVVPGTSEVSIGFDNGTINDCIYNYYSTAPGDWYGGAFSIFLSQTDPINYGGMISSLDADGFTISWTKTGAKTGTATIQYIAFR